MKVLIEARLSLLRRFALCLVCLSAATSVQAAAGEAEPRTGHAGGPTTRGGAIVANADAAKDDPAPSYDTDWLGFWANAYEYGDMEAWLGRPVRVAAPESG